MIQAKQELLAALGTVLQGLSQEAVDAELLLTTLAGAIHHRAFMRSEELTDAYLEALVDMLVSGVGPR